MSNPKKDLIPPFWYAVGSIVTTPLVVLCMIVSAALIIVAWPIIPVLCYFQRKEELSKKIES